MFLHKYLGCNAGKNVILVLSRWITYKTVDEAESAVAAHEQLQSGGRHLRIQFSHSGPPGQRNRNTRYDNNAETRRNGLFFRCGAMQSTVYRHRGGADP